MSVPTRSCASAVAAPTWGVATTRGCCASRQSAGGSCACTSSAAPATRPLSSAASSASSSISSPRAALTMRMPGFTLGERVLAHQVARLLRQRRVQRQEVAGLQQLVEGERAARAAPRPAPARRTGRRRRPPCRAPGSARRPRGRCGRGRPRRCACRCSSTPAKDLRSHFPAFIDGVGLRDVARHGQEQRQRQLGGGDEVAAAASSSRRRRGAWPRRGPRCRRPRRAGR